MKPIASDPTARDQPAVGAIRLNACAAFDRLEVRTQQTVYDVVVLRGSTGEALVRGGRYFRIKIFIAVRGN